MSGTKRPSARRKAALSLLRLEDRLAPASAAGGFTDHGLTGTYFSDDNFTTAAFTRRDVRIDFDWGSTTRPGGSLSPGFRDVGADNFSARWTGQLVPRFSETYTFSGNADDVFKLELKPATSGTWTTVVDQAAYAAAFGGTYAMTAGTRYDVRVSFREFSGNASARLLWSGPSTPLEVIDPLTQSGINNPDGAAFADIVRGARNSWEGVDGNPRPTTDANGWPQGNGSYVFQESLNQGLGIDPLMRGRVQFSFNGKADVSLFGNVDGSTLTYSYNAGTNTTTGSFVVRDNSINASAFNFRNSTRTGVAGGPGGITNLRIMKPVAPDATTAYAPDQIFSSHIKGAMGNFTVVRHQYVANQQKEWSDRTRPAYFNQAAGSVTNPQYGVGDPSGNGWSWEHKVMFANETGSDLMISIPTVASGRTAADTQSYVYKLANLIRYGSDGVEPYTSPQANPVYPPLNPNLRVFLELENELWNFFGVFYTDYGNLNRITAAALDAGGADAQALNFDNRSLAKNGNGDYNEMGTFRLRMAMLRTIQISNIFRGVFGDAAMPGTSPDPRIRPVYQWQYDNLNGTASGPLQWADRYFNNGDGVNRQAVPRPVNYYLWGGGGAAYYGANNPNGLTDRVPNAGFDATAVGNGYTQNPSGASWSFTGTAGIARDGGSGDDVPAAFNGGQVGYVAGTGRMTDTFTVPASQTSNVYGFSFKAHNRRKAGAANPDTQNLRVYLDYGTANQADVTARTFSQGNGYTPPAIDQIGAWKARNVFWTESDYYYTKSFNLAAGSTHTITIVGTAAADQLAFIDDARVTSVDAIFAGGIPGGGEATGQPTGQNIRNTMNVANNWAAAYGLTHIAYESGWSLGGDDGGSYVQLRAKYGDGRTAAAQGTFMDYYHEAGGLVNVFGTYAQWPNWSDYYAEQGLLNAADYPIVQGINQQADRLPNLPTNNVSLATTGTTTVAPAVGLSPDWQTDTGPQFSVNRRTQYGYTVFANAAGNYTLSFRLANAAAGGSVRVLVDGRSVGTVSVPNTGGRDTFQDVGSLGVTLTRGRHAVVIVPLANASSGYAANAGDLKVTVGGTTSPPPTSPPPTSPPPAGSGTGLSATYWDNTDFTGATVTRTDAAVNFDWGTGSPAAAIGVDTFSARWTGQVQAVESGTYTFRTYSDDGVRLWVNGVQLVNNWTDHGPAYDTGTISLTAGQKYSVRMEFYENGGGAVAQLQWQRPGQAAFAAVPQAQLFPAGAAGTITQETWTGIAGTAVGLIPTGTAPNSTAALTSFEIATNALDNYGVRVRGYITAPATGSYTFWIASDDNGELWLSTTDSPANRAKIAGVTSWTNSREWGKEAGQRSAAVNLVAGQRYYVEALMKEGNGGDNLAVGWARPGQSATAPSEVIPGSVLSPFAG